jgi:hypothetical protein
VYIVLYLKEFVKGFDGCVSPFVVQDELVSYR